MIDLNTHFGTFKYLIIKSYKLAEYWTLPSQDNEVDIPVIAEVFRASETDEQIPDYPPGPPV